MNDKKISRGPKGWLRIAAVLAITAGFVAGAMPLGGEGSGTGCCIERSNTLS